MTSLSNRLVNDIAQIIYDKKGSNILALNVSPISSLTDVFIIAEGAVDRHVIAIAKALIELMASHDCHPLHIEGMQNGDWIVLDYNEIIIHLFTPELRERYAFERVWTEAKIIHLDIRINDAKSIG